jgi:multimeric flavodoxin WrbA
MAIRMVAIHGSARDPSNSGRLLEEAILAAQDQRPELEVELIRAYDTKVDPCIACDACNEDQVGCFRKHDEWHRIEPLLRSADVLVIASPVYFMGLPAPVKAIVDRLQALWWYREGGGQVATNEGPFRRAGLILVAAGKDGVFVPSRRVAKAAINTLGFDLHVELLAGGLEDPDVETTRPELLKEAHELGQRLVE